MQIANIKYIENERSFWKVLLRIRHVSSITQQQIIAHFTLMKIANCRPLVIFVILKLFSITFAMPRGRRCPGKFAHLAVTGFKNKARFARTSGKDVMKNCQFRIIDVLPGTSEANLCWGDTSFQGHFFGKRAHFVALIFVLLTELVFQNSTSWLMFPCRDIF